MITVNINSTDRSDHIEWPSLSVTQNLTQLVDTAQFRYNKWNKSYIPEVGDDIEIYDDSTKVFGGQIISIDEGVATGAGGLTYDIKCVDHTYEFDSQLVAKAYEGNTVKEIIDDIVTTFTDGSFTTTNVVSEYEIDKIVFNQLEPSKCLKRLAKALNYYWYIDEDKDIHFFPILSESAPFDLEDDNGNMIYKSLKRMIDGSQIANYCVVRGGLYDEDTTYSDYLTVSGNETSSFSLSYQMANLEILLDDESVTDTMEGGTTTTTVKATGHGLNVGDFVKNITRSDAIREVLTTPDADTFTVAAVTGQASGDTFSIFQEQSVGLEFVDDYTSDDVLYDYQQGTIRWENPLADGDLIRFTGNRKIQVLAVAEDPTSVAQFGQRSKIIRDNSIEDLALARKRAQAEIQRFKDTMDQITFKTRVSGLRAGMTVNLNSTDRGIDVDYIISSLTFSTIDPETFEYSAKMVNTLSVTFDELLALLMEPDTQLDDETEVSEIIKTDIQVVAITETITNVTPQEDEETVTINETITKDPLGAGVEPTWVIGIYTPSPYPTDTKRQGLLNVSMKLY